MKLVEISYFTDNVEKMAAFYRHLLRSEPVAQSEGMAIFMSGEIKVFIHHSYDPAEGELPPDNHIAFAVENVDTVCQQLVEAGLTLEALPQDFYWGRSAYLRDPDGQQIEITQVDAGEDRGEERGIP